MLSVVRPGGRASDRFEETLAYALEKHCFSVTTCLPAPIENRRLLFAVPLNESGINSAYYQLLAFLRTHPGSLKGCVGGVLVDGPGKQPGQMTGRDEHGTVVAFAGEEGLGGQFVQVKITEAQNWAVAGELV